MKTSGFYAYPAHPAKIGQTIEQAIDQVAIYTSATIDSWKALDVPGQFISEQVLGSINEADYLVADITTLNFNVVYEIGYAIGSEKRVLITKNKSIKEQEPSIREVGIFDTLGYEEYENSSELSDFISRAINTKPIQFSKQVNSRSPVYLLEGKHKTDLITRIISRIKAARYLFRSFDPAEQPRLSADDAIKQVAQSHGIVIPLLAPSAVGSDIHNLRAAFLAGLAHGMGKACKILQEGDEPVPVDYRDFVSVVKHPNDINDHIAEFAGRVAESFQQDYSVSSPTTETFIQSLDLGATSAENEMRTLEKYYLKTDQFLKSLHGDVNLVVGRKGSGKSAIFLQIRDRERSKAGNIVLDLKPDGYKLLKFKELILSFLQEGTYQHTIMAFWEYVLLLEICNKIIEADRIEHINNHHLFEPYRSLVELYHSHGYVTEGDFSERMSALMEKIATEYRSRHGEKSNVRLSTPELTELLYSHDVKRLATEIASYMKNKKVCWLLFDNIDKGWPTSGLQHEDLIIIRALLDASRKIERQLGKSNVEVNSIVFLRNDVYELLVRETSDRGKEAYVVLDWTDTELLREMVRLRVVANGFKPTDEFEVLWPRICVSHFKGEETSEYLIERSLMRPRFLLNLLNQCKSFAVNLNHETIQEEDITKGLIAYSTDLLTDICYELNDVGAGADDVLYAFISCPALMTQEKIHTTLLEYNVEKSSLDEIFELLLWYGFLGVSINGGDKYIYNFNYNMQLLEGWIKKHSNSSFVINPAFRPGLMIE